MQDAGFDFIGQDKDGELVDAFKYRHNHWYVGVKFSPEYSTAVMKANPTFFGFVQAVYEHEQERREQYTKKLEGQRVALESGMTSPGDVLDGYGNHTVEEVFNLVE
jgi:hypothetical protein